MRHRSSQLPGLESLGESSRGVTRRRCSWPWQARKEGIHSGKARPAELFTIGRRCRWRGWKRLVPANREQLRFSYKAAEADRRLRLSGEPDLRSLPPGPPPSAFCLPTAPCGPKQPFPLVELRCVVYANTSDW